MGQYKLADLVLALVLLSAVNIVAWAQSPCCFPEQFEAYVSILEGYYVPATDAIGEVEGTDFVSYDYTNQRMMNNLTLNTNGTLTRGLIIIDYKQGIRYDIFNNRCLTSNMTGDLPRCLPDNAIATGTAYFGAGNNKLEFYNFKFTYENLPVTMSVTKDHCIPISETLVGSLTPNGTVDGLVATTFIGLTTGIKDTKVFDVPTNCKHSNKVLSSPTTLGTILSRKKRGLD